YVGKQTSALDKLPDDWERDALRLGSNRCTNRLVHEKITAPVSSVARDLLGIVTRPQTLVEPFHHVLKLGFDRIVTGVSDDLKQTHHVFHMRERLLRIGSSSTFLRYDVDRAQPVYGQSDAELEHHVGTQIGPVDDAHVDSPNQLIQSLNNEPRSLDIQQPHE